MKIKVLGKLVAQSSLSKLFEKVLSFAKILYLSSGVISIHIVDSYFLQLVIISLVFTSTMNAVEYAVNKNLRFTDTNIVLLTTWPTIFLYFIMSAFFSFNLVMAEFPFSIIALWSFYTALYVTNYVFKIFSRIQNIYWNNDIPEILLSVFLIAFILAGLITDLRTILIYSILVN